MVVRLVVKRVFFPTSKTQRRKKERKKERKARRRLSERTVFSFLSLSLFTALENGTHHGRGAPSLLPGPLWLRRRPGRLPGSEQLRRREREAERRSRQSSEASSSSKKPRPVCRRRLGIRHALPRRRGRVRLRRQPLD